MKRPWALIWNLGRWFNRETFGRTGSPGSVNTQLILRHFIVCRWLMGLFHPRTSLRHRSVSLRPWQGKWSSSLPRMYLGKTIYNWRLPSQQAISIYHLAWELLLAICTKQHSTPSQHSPYFIRKSWPEEQLFIAPIVASLLETMPVERWDAVLKKQVTIMSQAFRHSSSLEHSAGWRDVVLGQLLLQDDHIARARTALFFGSHIKGLNFKDFDQKILSMRGQHSMHRGLTSHFKAHISTAPKSMETSSDTAMSAFATWRQSFLCALSVAPAHITFGWGDVLRWTHARQGYHSWAACVGFILSLYVSFCAGRCCVCGFLALCRSVSEQLHIWFWLLGIYQLCVLSSLHMLC